MAGFCQSFFFEYCVEVEKKAPSNARGPQSWNPRLLSSFDGHGQTLNSWRRLSFTIYGQAGVPVVNLLHELPLSNRNHLRYDAIHPFHDTRCPLNLPTLLPHTPMSD